MKLLTEYCITSDGKVFRIQHYVWYWWGFWGKWEDVWSAGEPVEYGNIGEAEDKIMWYIERDKYKNRKWEKVSKIYT